MKRTVAVVWVCLLLAFPALLSAQTASTGAVLGTVTDPQGAVIVGADVKLESRATNVVLTQKTNASGQYVFGNVSPGVYTLTVSNTGFKTHQIDNIRVEVTKSHTYDVPLELGEIADVVQVESTDIVRELQTSDSTVGTVISGRLMPRMPALSRTANEVITLQPGVTPTGAVTGSREDQTTFTLDGIDVTNNSIGGLATVVPLPIDGIEEFRVGVANPNASFGRGAGGQVAVVGKSGSRSYHGLAFWYHQNDNFNANTWTRNRIGQDKPELKDNRFGFNFGGPIPFLEERTTFFAHYEGRRFPRTSEILRIVPSALLRQGIMQFRDATGVVRQYPLATATNCGPNADQACDPRGIGLSPTIAALWDRMPAGNDPSSGDGLNTLGFRDTISNSLTNDYYNMRLDHNLTSNWRIEGAFRYFGQTQAGATLLDITGGEGNTISRESFPARTNNVVAALRGQFSPNLVADFRFGWVRTRTAVERFRPNQTAAFLAIPGTDTSAGHIALDIGARGGLNSIMSEPIDVDTQVARKQANDNRLFQWNADMVWVRGTHTAKFGTHVRYLPTLHLRDDKVLGALGALVAQIDSDTLFTLSPNNRPPACSATVTTFCLTSGEANLWNRTYAGVTGIIDNVSVLQVWDGDFNPLPFGELLEADTKLWAPEFYFEDTWRLSSTLTFIYGLHYGWQQAPSERLGRQSFQIDAGTTEFITSKSFFKRRAEAALAGGNFNPDFGFLPINASSRNEIFRTDYSGFAPNVAAAWNPSANNGFLGRLFGDRKTVIRGGYRLLFDRQNTVQSVIIPTLGIAFGQTINVSAPLCNATGPGGPGCDPAAGIADPASGLFRVGVDGTIPLPTVPSRSIPVVPEWGLIGGNLVLFPEILSFQVDPDIEVPHNHVVDLTWQREMPWNLLLEVGYVGRFARNLTQSMNLGQVPFIHVDSASGQSFAQAFDAVALALRDGIAPGAIPTQAWFENNIPASRCAGLSCTQFIATTQSTNFIRGNVFNLFLGIDIQRMIAGLEPFGNYMSGASFLRSSTGRSNYNGVFISLHKRMSHGLLFTTNYTFSRSLDQLGAVQNAASVMPNNFDLDAEYGPSPFDNTHLFNTTALYELPLGRGRFVSTNSGILDRVIGGWYISNIFTARSGLPLIFVQGGQVWGSALFLGFNTGMVPTVDPKTFGNSVNSGVTGSGGIGVNSDPAPPRNGTGLNLFSDPEAVFKSFRHVELSRDGRSGRSRPIPGLPRWNLDMSIGKKTTITEQVMFVFSFDFFNIFNHVDFNNPALNVLSPATFGVITSQFSPANRTEGSRWIQFGARLEF